jgi:hypothetical protein
MASGRASRASDVGLADASSAATGAVDAGAVDAGAALGRAFIEALVRGDFEAMQSLLHRNVRMRGLTPHKFTRVSPSDPVGGVIRTYQRWFYEDETEHPEELLSCSVEPFGSGGRYKLRYRIRSKSRGMADFYRTQGLADIADDEDWLVDQEAYYDVLDGRIAWLIVLCGGYQPLRPLLVRQNVPETEAEQLLF